MVARIHEFRALVAPRAIGGANQATTQSSPAPSTDFAAALAAAGQTVAASSGQGLVPSAPLPGARPTAGPSTVSGIKAAWQNGRVPESALVPLGQRGHRLAAPAAAAFTELEAAARASGVALRMTDSYRSYEQQVDLARRKGSTPRVGWPPAPGRASTVGGSRSTWVSTRARRPGCGRTPRGSVSSKTCHGSRGTGRSAAGSRHGSSARTAPLPIPSRTEAVAATTAVTIAIGCARRGAT